MFTDRWCGCRKVINFKNKIMMGELKQICEKIDFLSTAIESVEVLINNFGDDNLKPFLVYLNQSRTYSAIKLSEITINTEVKN